jgi:hypothetical protein
VYLSLAGRRKLLPQPCPQCGLENGGYQLVLFNPKYYLQRTGYARDSPYVILRISHYSKEKYSLSPASKKNKRTKIWHNFRTSAMLVISSIPVSRVFAGSNKKSMTIRPSDVLNDYFKKNGWKIETKKAHFIKKGGLKKCDICRMVFKSLYEWGFGRYSSQLCRSCFNKENGNNCN